MDHERAGSLAVRTVGSVGSPIVLLHGLEASGRSWGGAYDRLASEHRLVVPDLLGFGRSPRPASAVGIDDHAAAVARCLSEVGVDGRPALIVGHSLGSLVALRLAARHPGLVGRVVAFGLPVMRSVADLQRGFASTSRGSRRLRTKARCFGIAHRFPRWRPTGGASSIGVVLSADIPGWLRAATTPVHLVVGTEDHVADLSFARTLSGSNPHVEVIAWPHARHDVTLAHPAACRVVIEELLERPEHPVAPAR